MKTEDRPEQPQSTESKKVEEEPAPEPKTASEETNSEEDDPFLDDTILGCKLAALAILNDEPDCLKREHYAWWHTHAIRMITGNKEESKKGLTYILSKFFGLTVVDEMFDIVKETENDKKIDMQGYIAHNDDLLVLAFRGSHGFNDDLIDIDFISSLWNVKGDAERGYGSKTKGRNWIPKPLRCHKDMKQHFRVHTGFYNNFLNVLPLIKQHILPFLGPDQPPRKILICGHSLGGAVATLSGTFLLLGNDWNTIPQKLRIVTMGAPRPCNKELSEHLQDHLNQHYKIGTPQSHNAFFARVKRNIDMITTLPGTALGFAHFQTRFYALTEDNQILLNQSPQKERVGERIKDHLKQVIQNAKERDQTEKEKLKEREKDDDLTDNDYFEMALKYPEELRDHMPDLYLLPFRVKSPRSFG